MSNRDALLQAAKDLLRTKGYARTTARDLVAASGANLSSIGYHFGSKEALLTEAFDEVFGEWTAQLTAAGSAPGASALERRSASWTEMLGTLPEHRDLMLAFVESIGPSVRSPELRERLAAHYAQAREQVSSAVAESLGPESTADPDVVASYLIAVADGFMIQFLVDPEHAVTGRQLTAALAAALATALAD